MRLPTVLLRRGRRRAARRHRLPGRLGARHPRLRALGAALGAGAADRDRRRPLLRRQRGARRLLRPDRRHRERLARDGRAGDDRGRRPRRRRRPTRSGRSTMQAPNGVVDVVVADEAEATAADQEAARLLPGRRPPPGAAPDQDAPARARPRARSAAPTTSRRSSRRSPTRARSTFLRERFAPEMVTALARIEGRPLGHRSPTTPATWPARSPATPPTRRRASCSSATPSACRSSRWSTRPGMMVGPEAEATGLVRHASRLLVAGAALRVPLIAVDPAPRLRPRRPGDGRRQPARAAADGRLADAPHLGADGARGRGAAGAAQGARGDRRRGRARAAGPRPDRRTPRRTRRRSTRRRCSSSTT